MLPFVGCCWLLLAAVGCWLLLVVGCWLLLAVVGRCRLSVVVGCCWLLFVEKKKKKLCLPIDVCFVANFASHLRRKRKRRSRRKNLMATKSSRPTTKNPQAKITRNNKKKKQRKIARFNATMATLFRAVFRGKRREIGVFVSTLLAAG